jgi:hypothetical protein
VDTAAGDSEALASEALAPGAPRSHGFGGVPGPGSRWTNVIDSGGLGITGPVELGAEGRAGLRRKRRLSRGCGDRWACRCGKGCSGVCILAEVVLGVVVCQAGQGQIPARSWNAGMWSSAIGEDVEL